MSLATAIAIYFIIWWVVLFAVLPWGVRSQEEGGDVVSGTDPGRARDPAALVEAGLDDGGLRRRVCGVRLPLHQRIVTLDGLIALFGLSR